RQLAERPERLPGLVLRSFVKARSRTCECHEIELTVARQIEELGSTARRPEQGGVRAKHLERTEPTLAEVGLVEPRACLLRQDPGDALAIEVYPLVGRAVDADGQVRRAARIEVPDLVLDLRLAVLE